MSKIVQWKRGNTAAISTYTGAVGEIVVNTDTWSMYVHDGVTAGGHMVEANIAPGDLTITGNLTTNNITANSLITSTNLSTHNITVSNSITATGNITAGHFVGDGSALTNLSVPSLGNVRIYDQTIVGAYQISEGRPLQIGDVGGNVTLIGNISGFGNTALGPLTVRGTAVAENSMLLRGNTATKGYYFDTGANVQLSTGLVHIPQSLFNPNVSVLALTHSQISALFYSNATTEIVGNLVITGTSRQHGIFANAFIEVYSNVNSYSQLISQNLSDSSFATTDYVLTTNDGTDVTDYLDIGIAGSGYNNLSPFNSLGTSIDPRDGYIYVQGNVDNVYGGNLTIGTSLPGKVTKILSGGVNAEDVTAIFSNVGLFPGANVTYSLGSTGNQWKDLWVGNIEFSDTTTQTTAYQLTAAPTSSKGLSGDKMGMVAYDSVSHYYCKEDYTTGLVDIWVKVDWTGTSW
jgi:hypothetical protein